MLSVCVSMMVRWTLALLIALASGGTTQDGAVASTQGSNFSDGTHLLIYELDLRVVPFGDYIDKAIAWLKTVSDLGFNGLWILPPFEKANASPYCPKAYETLDEAIFHGSEDSLVKFVGAARDSGFKVFIDIMTLGQCCANSEEWYGKLLRTNSHNPHLFSDICEWKREYILNEVQDMVIDYTSKWISKYGFDGVRCDSASFIEWYYDFPASDIQTFWEKIIQGINGKTADNIIFLAEGNSADVLYSHWPYIAAGFDYVYCSYGNGVGQSGSDVKTAVMNLDFSALLGAVDTYVGAISSSFNFYAYVNTHDMNQDATNPYNHNAEHEALAVIVAMFSSPVFGSYSGTEFGSYYVPNFDSYNRYSYLVNDPHEDLRCFYSRALPLFGLHMRKFTWRSYKNSTRTSSGDALSIGIAGEIELAVGKVGSSLATKYAHVYDLTLPGSSVSMVVSSVQPLSFLSAGCNSTASPPAHV